MTRPDAFPFAVSQLVCCLILSGHTRSCRTSEGCEMAACVVVQAAQRATARHCFRSQEFTGSCVLTGLHEFSARCSSHMRARCHTRCDTAYMLQTLNDCAAPAWSVEQSQENHLLKSRLQAHRSPHSLHAAYFRRSHLLHSKTGIREQDELEPRAGVSLTGPGAFVLATVPQLGCEYERLTYALAPIWLLGCFQGGASVHAAEEGLYCCCNRLLHAA